MDGRHEGDVRLCPARAVGKRRKTKATAGTDRTSMIRGARGRDPRPYATPSRERPPGTPAETDADPKATGPPAPGG